MRLQAAIQRMLVWSILLALIGVAAPTIVGQVQPPGTRKPDLTPEQRKIAKTVINSGVLDARAQKNKITSEQQYLLDLQTRLQTA